MGGAGVEPPTNFSKRGGLDRTSTEGVAGKEGVTFFGGRGGGVVIII